MDSLLRSLGVPRSTRGGCTIADMASSVKRELEVIARADGGYLPGDLVGVYCQPSDEDPTVADVVFLAYSEDGDDKYTIIEGAIIEGQLQPLEEPTPVTKAQADSYKRDYTRLKNPQFKRIWNQVGGLA